MTPRAYSADGGHVADQDGQRFLRVHVLEGVDPLDGLVVADAAGETVDGVGGDDRDATLAQHIGGAGNEPGLRFGGVDFDDHGVASHELCIAGERRPASTGDADGQSTILVRCRNRGECGDSATNQMEAQA